MFEVIQDISNERIHQYAIARGGQKITYAEALSGWQSDESFRSFFIALLQNSPFTAYRWETPPITTETTGRDFEFVLLDSPALTRHPDRPAFAAHFAADGTDQGIVAFDNLSRDAMLVVPSPQGPDPAYVHLASFVRCAPLAQVDALWQVVGRTVKRRLSDRPLWVSTAGGGIAWLHVRLDSWPKYYGYAAYTTG